MRSRVLDFGLVSAMRSQAVYHGLAKTMTAHSDPILALASPLTPYVCVGMHQDIAKEVDEAFCAEQGLPIYRRHVGGGAVYLDQNQLFTHFIYPRSKAPDRAAALYPMFIEPVVRTYREMGIPAAYRPVNDIHVDGRKIGGTGAATIGNATVMVDRLAARLHGVALETGALTMAADTAIAAMGIELPGITGADIAAAIMAAAVPAT